MLKNKYFQKLAVLLNKDDRYLVLKLFAAFVVTSIIETAGVASVLPAISMVVNEGSTTAGYISDVFSAIGIEDAGEQKIWAVLFFVGVVVFANILGLFILRASCKASNIIEKNISARLLKSYLSRPYPYFLNNHTSNLHRNVLTEVSLIKTGIIVPMLNIFSKALTAACIMGLLFYVSPVPTLVGLAALIVLYGAMTLVFQKGLNETGQKRYSFAGALNKLSLESLTGVREVKLFGAQKQVADDFQNIATKLAGYKTQAQFISGSPRYMIEALILMVAGAALVYSVQDGLVLVDYLPIITLYVVAIYRMMPLFQAVYVGVSSLQFNYGSLEKVVAEFGHGKDRKKHKTIKKTPAKGKKKIAIAFSDVNFVYEEKKAKILDGFNLEIKRGQIVGLFGASGSGKTTILDLMLGLIQPVSGEVSVFSEKKGDNLSRVIGYVPQKLYLRDSTVAENVAFGETMTKINLKKVKKACKMAQIDDVIEALDDGYLTQIGENAARLSGGQRQRLAIARALYHDPEILILDEATNGLDEKTENSILNNILTLKGKTIVLVSHHKSVMSFCDVIYKLAKGQAVDIITKKELEKSEGL